MSYLGICWNLAGWREISSFVRGVSRNLRCPNSQDLQNHPSPKVLLDEYNKVWVIKSLLRNLSRGEHKIVCCKGGDPLWLSADLGDLHLRDPGHDTLAVCPNIKLKTLLQVRWVSSRLPSCSTHQENSCTWPWAQPPHLETFSYWSTGKHARAARFPKICWAYLHFEQLLVSSFPH